MKFLLLLVGWFLLFILCWPLALLALIVAPILWVLSIPFMVLGIVISALVALLKAILFLPARLLGHRGA